MSSQQKYRCANCQGEVQAPADENTPECCGQPMNKVPMEPCTLSTTAEHSRLNEENEPCDDGRAG